MINEIIKRLEELEEHCLEMYGWHGQTITLDAIKIVQEVAKEYGKDTNVLGNGWIPCSERLPEPYKKVLVYEEDGEIYMAKYHADIKRFSHVRSAWCVRENEVVAWMPLPIAPYQKGE